MQNILILISALGSGLIAGAFFAFSSFVMGALGKLPASQGIAAMQSINVVVINPIFLGVLFGTAALALYLGFGAIRHLGDPRAIWVVAGTGLYVIGTILVTMAFNVPLNNAIAAVDPASGEGAAVWADYLRTWTNWNHARGLAALAASGAFISALFNA
ncbi:MAG: DUF1772 domain-containing protein [Aestuariivirga sp.]|nr:DUF1772 domain-containing protein [Aestuariivirga sp.]